MSKFQQQKIIRHIKKQETTTHLKEEIKSPEIDCKEMEIHELPEKEFKITIRIFNELKHKIDIPLNEIRKTIHKQSEIINEETETWKKNQTEIPELKKTLPDLKTSLEELKIKLDQTEKELTNSKTEPRGKKK